MFDFDDDERGEGQRNDPGAEKRYQERRDLVGPSLWFWWLVHNTVAHFLIGVLPIRIFFRFHDWTAQKIGSRLLRK